MVANANTDIYASFQPRMSHEESSEEGSGLHSPVFAPPYPTHGDSFRYQHDQLDGHHSTTSMMPPQYGYPNTLSPHQQQQPPMGDSALELPNVSSARHDTHVSFTSHYPIVPRNHSGIEFSNQGHTINSRTHPPAPQHPAQPVDFRYALATERRLPSGPSHDHSSYIRPAGTPSTMPMQNQNDHKSVLVASNVRAETSPTADASTSSRETRKEISSVVIACRQCRSRKIRCDSTRPVCNNCVRRSNECVYDSVPKRRGPDKTPGTRQRTCKKRTADGSVPPPGPPQKRKRTNSERPSSEHLEATSPTTPKPRQATASSSKVKENLQKSSQQSPLLEIKRQSPPPHPLDRHPLPPPYAHQHPQSHSHAHPHPPPQSHPHPHPHPQLHPHPHPHLHPHPHETYSAHPHHHHQLHPSQQQHHHQATPSPTELRMSSDNESHYKHDGALPGRDSSYMYEQGSYSQSSYPRQLDVNTSPSDIPIPPHRKFPGPTTPIIKTDTKLWWDKILKSHSLTHIVEEVQFLVQNTAHSLSFINPSFLIKQLHRDEDRLRIQPSFILYILAMGKLMKSSAIEGSTQGLERALALAREAKNAFDEAINSEWLDATLVEAALIQALFESSAHPEHSPEKATASLIQLDQLIHKTALTSNDRHDPSVVQFSYDAVPVVYVDADPRLCACTGDSATIPDRFSHNPYILPWDPSWTSDQIRDEEIRRLCWSALTLISEYVSRCETFNEEPPRFYITEPANVVLLFPGEVMDRVSPAFSRDTLSPKDSIWALYCRSMLLWNFCGRFRIPSQHEDRAELAMEATNEVMAIEDSLNCHQCNLDTTLIYTCREYIHNIRMLVNLALRGFHGLDISGSTPGPIFNRRQAEDWLFYEDQVIRRVNAAVHQLHYPAAHQLTRRPFRINWFINQLTICLVLWEHDPTLDDALKLGKSILIPIDVLNALWPCPLIQQRCNSLRDQLTRACSTRNIELPFPPEFSVPNFIRS